MFIYFPNLLFGWFIFMNVQLWFIMVLKPFVFDVKAKKCLDPILVELKKVVLKFSLKLSTKRERVNFNIQGGCVFLVYMN